MKHLLLCAFLLFGHCLLHAQQFPSRDQWEHPLFGRIARVNMPLQNNANLKTEELGLRQMGRAPQFAKVIEVDLNPQNSGRWEEIEDSKSRWRLSVRSKDAYSLNFGFTRFYLPTGSTFFLINSQTGEKIGPFSSADNEDHAEFWSPIIESDEVILELELPTLQKSDLDLQLSYVNHDFMNFRGVLSADCHIDILCGQNNGYPQIEKFRDVAQSVGLMTIRGSSICTGFLVNNSKEDCRPYFMTARHCQSRSSDAPSLVVYWNFQNSFCRQPGSTANSSPGDGAFKVFNSGMVQRATNSNSDFTLLEFDDPIEKDANAFFAGWNATMQTPNNGVATIHQAGTDEKRFSYSGRSTYLGNWGSSAQVANGSHLIVPRWDIGSTEDGSSGAPLFNIKGQVLGQLHGGTALCGNTGYDSFGTFDASWDAGGSQSTRLQEWLDPNKSGVQEISGRWQYQCGNTINIDQETRRVCGIGKATWNLQVNNPNALKVSYLAPDLPPGLSATFSNNPNTGTKATLEVSNSSTSLSGFQVIKLLAIVGVDTLSRFVLLEIIQEPAKVQALEPQNGDNLVPLPVQLRWNKAKYVERYTILLAQDANFSNIVGRYYSFDTTYQIPRLDLKGTYYWKVWGTNQCDTSQIAQNYQEFSIAPSIKASVLPEYQMSCQADSLVFSLKAADGYKGQASISYRISPRFPFTLTFSEDPSKINAGSLIQAKAKNLRQLYPGIYELTFYTRQNHLVDSVKVQFEIVFPPSVPALKFPEAGTVALNKRPVFLWESAGSELLFDLELAQDSLFSFPVWNARVDLNTYQRQQDLLPGQYFWRVKASNTCSSVVSTVHHFTVFQSNLEKINNLEVGLEPVPSTGLIHLHLSNLIDGAKMELYNMSGQLLETFVPDTAFQDLTLNLSAYPAGMYVLRLKHRQSSVGLRLILQH